MLDYRRIQGLANRTTADARVSYESHRKHTMERIREALARVEAEQTGMARAGTDSRRILVAGAGNANDLDLLELAGSASELWLVDIDGDALSRALNVAAPSRDEASGISPNLKTWVGDAGGLVDRIDRFLAQTDKDPGALAWALPELAEAPLMEGWPRGTQGWGVPEQGFPREGSMDIAISQCLLSQIVWPVTEKAWQVTGESWQEGQRHLAAGAKEYPYPLLRPALHRLVLSHLSWLAWTVRPGGIVLVNSDVRWRGVPLYGANPLGLRHEAGTLPQLEWGNIRAWNWSIEESVEALILSVMARKPRVSARPKGSTTDLPGGGMKLCWLVQA